jgi:hypothetical protein
MSAVLAALRYAELDANVDRAFLLHITMRYGRKIVGAIFGNTPDIAADGGIGIQIWRNNRETDEKQFVTLAHVLWCEIEWMDGQ